MSSPSAPASPDVLPAAVDAAQWVAEAQRRREAGESLLALWASDERDRAGGHALHAAYLHRGALAVLRLALHGAAPRAPTISIWFPSAERMERAAFDLVGTRTLGGGTRPWLRHAACPADAVERLPVVYIGSTQGLRKRLADHLRGSSGNMMLHRHLGEGREKVRFRIVEENWRGLERRLFTSLLTSLI